MSVVKSCQLLLGQPLDEREHRCIDKADSIIGVCGLQLASSAVVGTAELLNPEGSGNRVVEEYKEVVRSQLCPAPVIELDHHRSWHYAWFASSLDQVPAPLMVRVRAIYRSQEWTGV